MLDGALSYEKCRTSPCNYNLSKAFVTNVPKMLLPNLCLGTFSKIDDILKRNL